MKQKNQSALKEEFKKEHDNFNKLMKTQETLLIDCKSFERQINILESEKVILQNQIKTHQLTAANFQLESKEQIIERTNSQLLIKQANDEIKQLQNHFESEKIKTQLANNALLAENSLNKQLKAQNQGEDKRTKEWLEKIKRSEERKKVLQEAEVIRLKESEIKDQQIRQLSLCLEQALITIETAKEKQLELTSK